MINLSLIFFIFQEEEREDVSMHYGDTDSEDDEPYTLHKLLPAAVDPIPPPVVDDITLEELVSDVAAPVSSAAVASVSFVAVVPSPGSAFVAPGSLPYNANPRPLSPVPGPSRAPDHPEPRAERPSTKEKRGEELSAPSLSLWTQGM